MDPRQTLNILLVEDNPDDVRLMRTLFAEANDVRFRVTCAGTLANARERAAENTFDLAMVDLSLPDATGMDTLHRVREILPETPIMVVTGLDDAETGSQAVHLGAQDYIVKGDFSANSLARTVRYAIERHKLTRELLHAHQSLRASQERYRRLVEDSQGLICTHDMNGVLLYVNPAATNSLGYAPGELIGKDLRELMPQALRHLFNEYIARITGSKTDDGLFRINTKNGEERIWSYSNLCQENDDGSLYVLGYGHDVTEMHRAQESLKNANEAIQKMATHDSLTGLPNRQLFYDLLSQAITYAARYKQILGVLFIDLDGFKQINDTHGHAVGDQLLKHVATTLKDAIRASDVPARLGGDEFVALLYNLGKSDGAGVVVEKIAARLREPVVLDGTTLSITGSIGIGLYPEHGTDPETLVRHADNAMYEAKRFQRGDYKFSVEKS